MPLNKSSGNMYDWIDFTWNPLGGACSHDCDYCYMKDMIRFPVNKERYSGSPRIIEKEMSYRHGSGRTIFVQNCSDLFAKDVPEEIINRIIDHCSYHENRYLFQSKNPGRFHDFPLPIHSLLGTTIETNRQEEIDKHAPDAPSIEDRVQAMSYNRGFDTMISIEPIMDFDVNILSEMLTFICPTFVSIGADSKRNRLTEPPMSKITELAKRLEAVGVEVKLKSNLARLEVTE